MQKCVRTQHLLCEGQKQAQHAAPQPQLITHSRYALRACAWPQAIEYLNRAEHLKSLNTQESNGQDNGAASAQKIRKPGQQGGKEEVRARVCVCVDARS